jgi:hypothetical protein
MKEGDKKYKIVLEFEKHKVLEIYFLAHSLQKHLEQDKDIPASVLKEFINLFEMYNRFHDVEKNYKENIEGCYDYLKNCGCDFSLKKVILSSPEIEVSHESENRIVANFKNPEKLNVKLSLYDLLEKCFKMIINFEAVESLRVDKKGMIEFIFDMVNSHNLELGKKRLSDYKIHIITGLIASYSNIIDTKVPTENNKPLNDYNTDLYHEVRNILRKKLPYGPLNY